VRGHVHRRGSTWTVVYDEPSPDGRRRQRSKGGFATRKAAQRFLTDTLARIDSGGYAEPSKTTLAASLADEWLPAVEGSLRTGSVATYRSAVRRWIVPHLGGIRLQALSGGNLNGLYRKLEEEGRSQGTRRLAHAVLRRALRDAVCWGRLPLNPADMANPPSRGRSKASAYTAGEVRRFLHQVEGDRLYALWRLAATTGMRRGELAGLTGRALDLGGARLRVEQQLLAHGSFGPPKSTRSRRTPRPWPPSGSIGRLSCSSVTSPPTRTRTTTSCSLTRWATPCARYN
jgi:integrase